MNPRARYYSIPPQAFARFQARCVVLDHTLALKVFDFQMVRSRDDDDGTSTKWGSIRACR